MQSEVQPYVRTFCWNTGSKDVANSSRLETELDALKSNKGVPPKVTQVIILGMQMTTRRVQRNQVSSLLP